MLPDYSRLLKLSHSQPALLAYQKETSTVFHPTSEMWPIPDLSSL